MKDDKELVRLAAKAAGLEIKRFTYDGTAAILEEDSQSRWGVSFNPLFDNGDAFRLSVRLRLSIMHDECLEGAPVVAVSRDIFDDYIEQTPCPPDSLAATRRAIVKAAAEIVESVGEVE